MKSKTLIIFLIILMSVVIFLLTMFLVSYLNGNINFKNGVFKMGHKSTNIVYDKKFNFEDIRDISIKQEAGDIIIKQSPDNYIQVVIYGNNDDDFNVNVANNDLDIKFQNKFRFNFFGFNQRLNDIIVYVPASYLNRITVKNNYGKCEIADLENATIDVDCDCGNVEVGKIKNANIKCDLRKYRSKGNT